MARGCSFFFLQRQWWTSRMATMCGYPSRMQAPTTSRRFVALSASASTRPDRLASSTQRSSPRARSSASSGAGRSDRSTSCKGDSGAMSSRCAGPAGASTCISRASIRQNRGPLLRNAQPAAHAHAASAEDSSARGSAMARGDGRRAPAARCSAPAPRVCTQVTACYLCSALQEQREVRPLPPARLRGATLIT